MKRTKFLDTFKIRYISVGMILVPLLLLLYFLNSSPPHLVLAQTVSSIENTDNYENPLFGLSIDYSSSWIIKEFDKKIKNDEIVGINNIIQLCPNTNTLKQVQSDQTNNNNNIKLCQNAGKNFAIYVHNLPPEMTLEEFTNSKISSYKLELTDFKIIESNPNIMIDDNPAYKVTYTYTYTDTNSNNNDDQKIQVMEVWTVITKDNDDDEEDDLKDHVNKAYSIRYEAIPIEFPIYLNTANNTISSFEFKKINDDKDEK